VTLTPFHLQIAGVAILVLLGVGTIWWIARIVIGRLRGRPMYMLPEADPDLQDEDDPDDGTQ
jgi:uncharacterized membrane protein